MTRAERTTVLLLLGLGVVGQLARLVWSGPGAPGEALSLGDETGERVDVLTAK